MNLLTSTSAPTLTTSNTEAFTEEHTVDKSTPPTLLPKVGEADTSARGILQPKPPQEENTVTPTPKPLNQHTWQPKDPEELKQQVLRLLDKRLENKKADPSKEFTEEDKKRVTDIKTRGIWMAVFAVLGMLLLVGLFALTGAGGALGFLAILGLGFGVAGGAVGTGFGIAKAMGYIKEHKQLKEKEEEWEEIKQVLDKQFEPYSNIREKFKDEEELKRFVEFLNEKRLVVNTLDDVRNFYAYAEKAGEVERLRGEITGGDDEEGIAAFQNAQEELEEIEKKLTRSTSSQPHFTQLHGPRIQERNEKRENVNTAHDDFVKAEKALKEFDEQIDKSQSVPQTPLAMHREHEHFSLQLDHTVAASRFMISQIDQDIFELETQVNAQPSSTQNTPESESILKQIEQLKITKQKEERKLNFRTRNQLAMRKYIGRGYQENFRQLKPNAKNEEIADVAERTAWLKHQYYMDHSYVLGVNSSIAETYEGIGNIKEHMEWLSKQPDGVNSKDYQNLLNSLISLVEQQQRLDGELLEAKKRLENIQKEAGEGLVLTLDETISNEDKDLFSLDPNANAPSVEEQERRVNIWEFITGIVENQQLQVNDENLRARILRLRAKRDEKKPTPLND